MTLPPSGPRLYRSQPRHKRAEKQCENSGTSKCWKQTVERDHEKRFGFGRKGWVAGQQLWLTSLICLAAQGRLANSGRRGHS